jgi:hypothetical protein
MEKFFVGLRVAQWGCWSVMACVAVVAPGLVNFTLLSLVSSMVLLDNLLD